MSNLIDELATSTILTTPTTSTISTTPTTSTTPVTLVVDHESSGRFDRPIGTVDLNEKDISIRNFIFENAKKILKLRGATQIETPAIELLSTVEKMYGGEFNKLVYNLNDEGQKIIMRYDLTVPLARYVGSHGLQKFKRFQYGKVYRRDNPQIQKGRLREFYQFDYDIIGDDQNSNSNDFEMLETLDCILTSIIGKNTYTIKINHKNIVLNLLANSEIPVNLYPTVFSSIDKLDKKSFDQIKIELAEKNIDTKSIQILNDTYNLFLNKTNDDLLNEIKNFNNIDSKTIEYLEMMNTFLKQIEINNFVIDPFLIRGMDYYTGILFEVVYNDKSIIDSTISAGGRYDNMIEKFSTKGKTPAIGMSIGVERIAKILELTIFAKSSCDDINNISEPQPQIFVATIGKNMTIEKIALGSKLRKMGFYVVFSDLAEPDMRHQFRIVFEKYKKIIPVMIVIGPDEIANNIVTIKDVKNKIQKQIKRIDEDLYVEITNILNKN